MSPEPRKPLGPEGRTEPLRPPAGAPPPDLTINVEDRSGREEVLTCKVTSPHLDEFRASKTGEWPLEDAADQIVAGYMKNFVKPNQTPGARLTSLRGAGVRLFKAAPQVFKDAYWQLVESGKPLGTILVASAERSFPWELMIPLPESGAPPPPDERMPLGARYNITRWYENGMERPEPAELADARVVCPESTLKKPLAKAPDETKLVIDTFGGESIKPALVPQLEEDIQPWRGSLLHFVCHGKTEGLMEQVLLLDGEEQFTPTQIDGMFGLQEGLHNARPLVFLNACEAGQEVITLMGSGGFAKGFIDYGARAVIAPLWSVADSDAFEVATTFYNTVVAEPEKPFGEILKDIRRKAYTEGKDTFAAYCLYGDPHLAAAA